MALALCVCVCRTRVVLSLQMHVTEFVDVADVHLLLVDLRLVEVLGRKRGLDKNVGGAEPSA